MQSAAGLWAVVFTATGCRENLTLLREIQILINSVKICPGPPRLSGPQIDGSFNNEVRRIVLGPNIQEVANIREGWDWEGEVGTSI